MSTSLQKPVKIGILFATGTAHAVLPTDNHTLVQDALGVPVMLLPALGKPMLQRALEKLIQLGCRKIHIILGEQAKPVRDYLNDGQRWGCELEYHYQHPGETAEKLLRRIGSPEATDIWLADAGCLPLSFMPDDHGELLYVYEHLGQALWSGWCRIERRNLAAMELPFPALGQHLMSCGMSSLNGPVLCSADLKTWHQGCITLLVAEDQATGFRAGKDSVVHASATIIAPVRIAENVWIGANCHIGPNAIIEAGSIIGDDTHLSQSIVLPNTFVGEHLSLTDCIVRSSQLVNIGIGSLTEIRDRHVLAGKETSTVRVSVRSRVLAATLRIVLYPIYRLSSWCLRRKNTASVGAVPPAHDLDSGQWLKHFTKDFYPGLANVMRGRTALVGPQARTAESIAALVPPWQRLYHNHHHGLLQEALFSIDGEHHADDLFASDALAAMQQHDAVAGRELLRRYLTRVMYDFGKRQ